MKKIRVFTAFSGYDSQCLALRRIGVPFDLVGWSEIDAHAIKAHNALFPEYTTRNYGDITQIDWSAVPDFDLFTYSSPCQDFSQAGLQRGGQRGSGTRSSLLWECERAIETKRPKYLLMENVAALVSQKFIKLFQSWMTVLEGYGYKNFAEVLNAKDYVPQNRERIFLVSIRVDDRAEWENVQYHFPKPKRMERRLKDVLETEVDKRYYLSDSRLEGVLLSTQKEADRGNGFAFEPKDGNDVASTIQTSTTRKTDNYIKEEANNISVRQNGKLKNAKMHEMSRRVYDTDYIAPTIHTSGCGNTEPKILCSRRTAEGKQLRKDGIERFADRQLEPKDDGTSNAITTVQKDNLLLVVCKLSESQNGRVFDSEGIAPAVTNGEKDGMPKITEPYIKTRPHGFNKGADTAICPTVKSSAMADNNYIVEPQIASLRGRCDGEWHETEHEQRMELCTDGNTNSLTSVAKDNMVVNNLRIRKLTERECFRLMGVDDSDIDIIQASKVSRSQQYKLAGNSIVVDVLAAIFDKMFLHTQPDDAQLKLF
jgi:DNA (cytosine-5)-methyltransferase 1